MPYSFFQQNHTPLMDIDDDLLMELLKKTTVSKIAYAGGPTRAEQVFSMVRNQYWTILNSSILKKAKDDPTLVVNVNALKNGLQTFGPCSKELRDLRNNQGRALGEVFHGHASDSNGVTYVLEWAVVDQEKRLLALVGFGSHENYHFRQTPLKKEEVKNIINSKESKKIIQYSAQKIEEAKQKVESMMCYLNPNSDRVVP